MKDHLTSSLTGHNLLAIVYHKSDSRDSGLRRPGAYDLIGRANYASGGVTFVERFFTSSMQIHCLIFCLYMFCSTLFQIMLL